MDSARRGLERQEDEGEISCEALKSVLAMSHVGHLFELLSFLLDMIDGLEIEAFLQHALGLRNIDPKDANNPSFAYFLSTPAWAKARPQFAQALESSGMAGRVRSRAAHARPESSGRRVLAPRLRPAMPRR